MTAGNRAIILNGTSSAGKSSIARELQQQLPGSFLHFKLDAFWEMLPEGKKVSDFPNMKFAIIDSAAALLRHGHNVVIDIVAPESILKLVVEALRDYDPLLVAVKASPETLRFREAARGDREIGMAEAQTASLYKGTAYDFEIDTTGLTAAESATLIAQTFQAAPIQQPRPATPAVS
jgi:chloramphenicol 3-O phosphotransferase